MEPKFNTRRRTSSVTTTNFSSPRLQPPSLSQTGPQNCRLDALSPRLLPPAPQHSVSIWRNFFHNYNYICWNIFGENLFSWPISFKKYTNWAKLSHFWRKAVFWHVEDLSWEISCVNIKENIIVNFIIQKLKSKYTFLKRYTNWAMLSHLEFSCETRKWRPKAWKKVQSYSHFALTFISWIAGVFSDILIANLRSIIFKLAP